VAFADEGQGRRLAADRRQVRGHAALRQALGEQTTEEVARQPAREGRRVAEPRDGDRDVERRPAGMDAKAVEPAAGHDGREVHQALPDAGDHLVAVARRRPAARTVSQARLSPVKTRSQAPAGTPPTSTPARPTRSSTIDTPNVASDSTA